MGIFDFLKTEKSPQQEEVSQEPIDKRKAECPSCGGTLKKVPGAKTKCPHCGEFMYARTRPDNVRLVLTGKQIAEVEQMELFLTFAGDQCGITPNEIIRQREKSIDMNNALWALSQQYLLENQKSGNFENVIALYRALENIRVSQNKSANYIVKRRMYFEMLRMKKEGSSLVIPVASYDSCSTCKKLDGKEFDIDEAIKTQPIPPENCTCLRCSVSI